MRLEGHAAEMAEELLDDTDSAWSRREAARQRQIMIGKARPEYRRYITEVPPDCRSSSQPNTPDPRARVSKRQFDRALGEWRRKLHEYDASPCSSWNGSSAQGWASKPPLHSPAGGAHYGDESVGEGVGSLGGTAMLRNGQRRQRPAGMAARGERAGRGKQGPRFSNEGRADAEFCSPNVESESLAPDTVQGPAQVVCLRLADQLPEASTQMPMQDNIQMEPFDMGQHAACTGPWQWALQYVEDVPDLAWHPETPQKNVLMPAPANCGLDDLSHLPDETPQKLMLPPRNGNRMMEEWTPQKMVALHSNQDEHMWTPDIYGCNAGDLEETRDAGTPRESSTTSTMEAVAEVSSQTGSWPSPPRLPKSPRTPPRALARSASPQSSIAATPARGFWVPETPSPERLYSSIPGFGSRSPLREPIQSCWFSTQQGAMWSAQMPPLCNYGMQMVVTEVTDKNETMPALM